MARGWRYHAQQVLTGEWLHRDVPLSGVEIGRALSAPDSMRAAVQMEWSSVADLLDPWATILYAENPAGKIRGAGIVVRTESDDTGQSLSVECVGFAGYPHGLDYLGEFREVQVDPTDAFRHIWQHVQDNRGDLGVVVDSTTSDVLIGSVSDRYELGWWEATDCGQELDRLAAEGSFDFREEHEWAADGSDAVDHRIRLGVPRFGRRRHDLRFVVGENLFALPHVERDGDEFANEVITVGMGEGRDMRRGRAVVHDGRLRRTAVVPFKDEHREQRLNALARREVERRSRLGTVREFVVRDHPNAPLDSWNVGDEVLLTVNEGYAQTAAWYRITGDAIQPDNGEVASVEVIPV